MENQTKNPVIVSAIYPTEGSETMQVLLSQEVEREITSGNGLLSLTMADHSAFKTGPNSTRTCFHPFSTSQIQKLGLVPGAKLPEEWNATLVVREFVPGEAYDVESKKFITDKSNAFKPYVSKAGKVQDAKRQGADGGILTKGGQPIYRNTYLSVKGMPTTDKLIEHDGVQEVQAVVNTTTEAIGNVQLP